MKTALRVLLIITVFAALQVWSPVFGQSQPDDLHVKLSLADNKTTYRIGEPVKLVLEFTADREGYHADTIPDGWQPTTDVISLTPTTGVKPWLYEHMGSQRYSRHVSLHQGLSKTPLRIELMLNDTLRFDAPGKYSVRLTTSRVARSGKSNDVPPTIPLTTNPVEFEIQPMSLEDEKKEVERLSALLDSARGWKAEEKITQELSYLTGVPSTHEKVKRFLSSQGRSGNYAQHIHFGLYIARDRGLVLRLLETALRDPNVPATWSLTSAVISLRMLQEYNGSRMPIAESAGAVTPYRDPRLILIEQSYLSELAAGLGKRVGRSQTTAAMTILMHLPKDAKSTDPVLTEVRRILTQQFDNLDVFDQEYLVGLHWDKLKSPELVPSLEKMLSFGGNSSKNVHDTALKALLEIAPEKARPYVIAEIRDPQSLVEFDLLKNLADEVLPEIDASLVAQIRKLTASSVNFDRVHLQHKVSLAARYASENVYPDLMEIYNTVGQKLPLETRAGLLAYLAKHNETEALPLIEVTMSQVSPDEDFNFLPPLTRLLYSDAIDGLLRKRLESDEPQVVSTAAYLMSLHGPAKDQKVIEARLERWQKEWRHRPAEADASLQGIAERELIMALGQAKSWKLAPEEVKELQQQCVTRICRQNFRLD
jgi:hypothetical protein